MSDAADRPRPAYGEYATPEEQRARMGLPDPVALPEAAPVVPVVVEPVPLAAQPTLPARPARPPADRVITLILLAVGAVNVLFSAPGLFSAGSAFARTYETAGIPGEFTNTQSADTWGAIAGVVLIASYLITALAAWRRLRAGRISWWIPVVGAVVCYAIVLVCLMVPVAGDPAFQEYVRSLSSSG